MSALEHEAEWWGDCINTWSEERKQIEYAPHMGLITTDDNGHYPAWNLIGRSVLDLGGGPASMLLKTFNGGERVVVDPCPYPDWVRARYQAKGIVWIPLAAEEYRSGPAFDECWIYNVLQHVIDPAQVIETAFACAKILRIFEWINIPADEMHPHTLTAELLDGLCGPQRGTVLHGVNQAWGESPAWSWSGVFRQPDSPVSLRG